MKGIDLLLAPQPSPNNFLGKYAVINLSKLVVIKKQWH